MESIKNQTSEQLDGATLALLEKQAADLFFELQVMKNAFDKSDKKNQYIENKKDSIASLLYQWNIIGEQIDKISKTEVPFKEISFVLMTYFSKNKKIKEALSTLSKVVDDEIKVQEKEDPLSDVKLAYFKYCRLAAEFKAIFIKKQLNHKYCVEKVPISNELQTDLESKIPGGEVSIHSDVKAIIERDIVEYKTFFNSITEISIPIFQKAKKYFIDEIEEQTAFAYFKIATGPLNDKDEQTYQGVYRYAKEAAKSIGDLYSLSEEDNIRISRIKDAINEYEIAHFDSVGSGLLEQAKTKNITIDPNAPIYNGVLAYFRCHGLDKVPIINDIEQGQKVKNEREAALKELQEKNTDYDTVINTRIINIGIGIDSINAKLKQLDKQKNSVGYVSPSSAPSLNNHGGKAVEKSNTNDMQKNTNELNEKRAAVGSVNHAQEAKVKTKQEPEKITIKFASRIRNNEKAADAMCSDIYKLAITKDFKLSLEDLGNIKKAILQVLNANEKTNEEQKANAICKLVMDILKRVFGEKLNDQTLTEISDKVKNLVKGVEIKIGGR